MDAIHSEREDSRTIRPSGRIGIQKSDGNSGGNHRRCRDGGRGPFGRRADERAAL